MMHVVAAGRRDRSAPAWPYSCPRTSAKSTSYRVAVGRRVRPAGTRAPARGPTAPVTRRRRPRPTSPRRRLRSPATTAGLQGTLARGSNRLLQPLVAGRHRHGQRPLDGPNGRRPAPTPRRRPRSSSWSTSATARCRSDMPTAMGKSNAPASFRKVRRGQVDDRSGPWAKLEARSSTIARSMRWTLSRTANSGRPTRMVFVNPRRPRPPRLRPGRRRCRRGRRRSTWRAWSGCPGRRGRRRQRGWRPAAGDSL